MLYRKFFQNDVHVGLFGKFLGEIVQKACAFLGQSDGMQASRSARNRHDRTVGDIPMGCLLYTSDAADE